MHLAVSGLSLAASAANSMPHGLELSGETEPLNIILILVDDQRWDAMSCIGHPIMETPALDSLVENGTRFANAYVTTSLCSPSRATILTGLYAHTHRMVDNQSGEREDLSSFGQYLQKAGYETAFIGKWHMGDADDRPRPGWSHWVSFRGQGHYYPALRDGAIARLNVNGIPVDRTKYITDELTDHAVEWLTDVIAGDKPWMLYLSHKAAHFRFEPAVRHRGRYAGSVMPVPANAQPGPHDEQKPMWARNMRNSWHGAEFPYEGIAGTVEEMQRDYYETLLAVDESTARILDLLRRTGKDRETLIIYTSDNGHLWGEHGLIDKRTAYEDSIRVPLILHCPGVVREGAVVDAIAANLDLAPTILSAAGLVPPPHYQGASLLNLARGKAVDGWREELLYEYFWERARPSTPTLHALITPRYKYIRAYGVWDLSELYDTREDPNELTNLWMLPEFHGRALSMDKRLFELLEETGGSSIPLARGWNGSARELRSPQGSQWSEFPSAMISDD